MYRDDDERSAYDRWHRYGRERGWFDKATDEVKSWFGDDEAERRRRMDAREGRGRDYGYEAEPRYNPRRYEQSAYGRGETYRRPFGWGEESTRDYGRERERESGGFSRYGRESSGSQYERPDWESERFNPYYESSWGGGRREFSGGYGGGYGRGMGGGSSYGGPMYGSGPGYGAGAASFAGGMGSPMSGQDYSGRGSKSYQRADERIRDEVHERLARHPAIDAQDIEVQAQNGEVTLTGNVVTRYEKRLSEELAEEVYGVRNVQNNIRVGRDAMQTQPSDGHTASSRPLRR
jgi:osmotically-inducible protein OsmY